MSTCESDFEREIRSAPLASYAFRVVLAQSAGGRWLRSLCHCVRCQDPDSQSSRRSALCSPPILRPARNAALIQSVRLAVFTERRSHPSPGQIRNQTQFPGRQRILPDSFASPLLQHDAVPTTRRRSIPTRPAGWLAESTINSSTSSSDFSLPSTSSRTTTFSNCPATSYYAFLEPTATSLSIPFSVDSTNLSKSAFPHRSPSSSTACPTSSTPIRDREELPLTCVKDSRSTGSAERLRSDFATTSNCRSATSSDAYRVQETGT